jgi:hypothetical protein
VNEGHKSTCAGFREIDERDFDSNDQRFPLYFLHIPKCGGTAFANALHRLFPPAAIDAGRLWDDVVGRPFHPRGLVHGHFGPAPLGELKQPISVSVLREPAARVISHYRHIRRDSGHYFHERVNRPGYGFGDFLRDPAVRPLVENHQARHLALHVDRAWLRRHRRSDIAPRTPHQAAFELEPIALDKRELFEAAHRTMSSLHVVVTTQHMDSAYRRLARMFGASTNDSVEPTNVAPPTQERIKLRRADRSLLRSLVDVDDALYRIALRRSARDQPAVLTGPGMTAMRPV